MIPKIIHFSWISEDQYPPLVSHCLKSWEKYAPGYEIVRWDKNRFGINSLRFTREALERKKWAFIADVQRLYALYHQGGIYLDSDVELLKPLDPLLHHRAFIGFEEDQLLSLGVLGSEPGHPWIKSLLDYYNDLAFVKDDGSLNNKPNTFIVTRLARKELNLQLDGSGQNLAGDVQVYPMTFFSPKNYRTGNIHLTSDTHAIHHFSGSWKPWRTRFSHRYVQFKFQVKGWLGSVCGDAFVRNLLERKRRMFSK